jgi:BMFP domain-containing protein YqiC
MTDPLTAIAASTIASLAFQKFIESAAGELAKKFTAEAITKMDELRQKIWDKMRGRSQKLDEALANLEKGDRAALETVTKNLDVVMDEEPEFAAEIRATAHEITLMQIKGDGLVQNNYGGTNFQNNIEGGEVYQGNITINKTI